ncbi:hypothetical protein KAU37_04700 [Candidatus Bipolaricaulota bacterium]|nr:hypothetical protein [Candidatus Bipolaricaulota bacterium]
MSKILTRDDFNRGCDRILRKQAKLLAILTRMEQGLRCDGAVEKDADKIKAGKG